MRLQMVENTFGMPYNRNINDTATISVFTLGSGERGNQSHPPDLVITDDGGCV